jgi:hypothetical protein
MTGICFVRHGLALALSGLFLVVGTTSAQTVPQLIDRIIKDLASRSKVQPRSDDDQLQKLLIERYNVALEEVQQRCEDFKKGLNTMDAVIESSRDMLTAEVAMRTDPQEKIKALERVIEIVRWYEGKLEIGLKEGVGLRADLLRARHGRLNYEIEVLRIKQGMQGAKSTTPN